MRTEIYKYLNNCENPILVEIPNIFGISLEHLFETFEIDSYYIYPHNTIIYKNNKRCIQNSSGETFISHNKTLLDFFTI